MGAVLLNKRDAADHLAISVRHLENLIKKEAVPVVRLGRSVRLTVQAVEELARRGA